MIVSFTRTQYEYLLTVVPEHLVEWFERDAREVTTRRVLVRSVVPAWILAREALYDRAFTNRGTKNADMPSKGMLCLKAVQSGINARFNHPALHKRAVIGRMADRVPAWTTDEGVYSPLSGNEFVVLEPDYVVRERTPITRWLPREALTEDLDWTCQEAVHLSLRADLRAALGWQPEVGARRIDQ